MVMREVGLAVTNMGVACCWYGNEVTLIAEDEGEGAETGGGSFGFL